ncbi:hypothetical protein MTR_3g035335 [Medicago truncatula]|uniref:Uncharacterized protein n=1 Tax=Medicago truncatula TaxID=3880 RepID=A0A072V5H2_MEDTR|nr:hypothetical protein MTR_3g035335 [Medicago truncatula]
MTRQKWPLHWGCPKRDVVRWLTGCFLGTSRHAILHSNETFLRTLLDRVFSRYLIIFGSSRGLWELGRTRDTGLKQTSNKKVRPRETQERDFVLKKILSFQPDSRSKWTPNSEGSCAMNFTTMDGDKLALPMNAGVVKKYSVKYKRSISRKPEKAA